MILTRTWGGQLFPNQLFWGLTRQEPSPCPVLSQGKTGVWSLVRCQFTTQPCILGGKLTWSFYSLLAASAERNSHDSAASSLEVPEPELSCGSHLLCISHECCSVVPSPVLLPSSLHPGPPSTENTGPHDPSFSTCPPLYQHSGPLSFHFCFTSLWLGSCFLFLNFPSLTVWQNLSLF